MNTETTSPLTAPLIALDTDTGTSGEIAYWRLGGAISADALSAALESAGIDCPDCPTATPATALKRAMEDVARTGSDLVRRHPKGGYIVIHERSDETGEHLEHTEGLRCWYEGTRADGRLAFNYPGHKLCSEIRDRFRFYLGHCTSREICAWLPMVLVHHLDAVSLRPGGGMYYVPAPTVRQWRKLTAQVSDLSDSRFFAVPALTTDDAVEAILDGLVNEAQSLADDMDRELERENIGERALDTQHARCDRFLGKLQRYEAILGQKLGHVAEGIVELTCAITEKIATVQVRKAAN